MPRTSVTRTIDAPVDVVFRTVSEPDEFAAAIPHIVRVEFLSDIKTGVGSRFRETRVMNGKENLTELEITEYVANDHVRIVADTHGTVWDTLFSVSECGEQTVLELVMDARAHRLLPRLMNPLVMALIKKYLLKDLDAVKRHCERQVAAE